MNLLERLDGDIELSTHVYPLLDMARYALEASHLHDELEAFSNPNADWGKAVHSVMQANEPCGKHEVKTTVANVLWVVTRLLNAYETPSKPGHGQKA